MTSVASNAAHLDNDSSTLDDLLEWLSNESIEWAVRGNSPTSYSQWQQEPSHELDLWAPREHRDRVIDIMTSLGFVPTSGDTPWRTGHISFRHSNERNIEWLFGPLSIGPISLAPEQGIAVEDGDVPRLDPVTRVIDALPRRLALGKDISSGELTRHRSHWLGLTTTQQESAHHILGEALGSDLARQHLDVLNDGAEHDTIVALGEKTRRRVGRAAMTRRAGWVEARRRLKAKVTRASHLDGRQIRGTVVTLIGTDGTGKSTSVERLRTAIEAAGLHCHDEYFGRTRGNLPGVARLRQNIEDREAATAKPTTELRPHPTRFIGVRKVASLYYAVEYALRYWRKVAPRSRRGEIVILDRFIYDLAVMPHASRHALTLATRLVPTPDLLFLLDAPANEINARKPERTVAEITKRQATFRSVLERVHPGVASAVLSTSAQTPTDFDCVGRAIAATAFAPSVSADLLGRVVSQLLSEASASR